MKDERTLDLGVVRVANGFVITYQPKIANPLEHVTRALKEMTEDMEKAPDDGSGEKKGPPPDFLLKSINTMQLQQNAMEEITMVYLSTEFERMTDDINNFLATGIPPASVVMDSNSV